MAEKTDILVGMAPKDTDMERDLLGGLILRPALMADVRDLLGSDCFDDWRHREMWEALTALADRGEQIELRTVTTELARTGKETGAQYVVAACTGTHPLADLTGYALTLRDLGVRRTLWEAGLKLMAKASDLSRPVEETHSEAKETIDGVYASAEEKTQTLAETYSQLQQQILANMDLPEDAIIGTPTGFPEIDGNGGLVGGDLIVVGAETSQGKTSFATALALSAIEHGEQVAFYSMEMTPLQLTARIGAMKSGLKSSQLLYGRVAMQDLLRMDAEMGAVNLGGMYFDGTSTASLDKIINSIRGMKHRHGIGGAVVDYLQLLNTGERNLSPEQRAAKCARDLKNLAKELGIWIIAISQLRRDPQSPEPSMSRLRDSGQIEEAADNIFLIYRPRDGRNYPSPFASYATQGTAMVKIAKGRNVGTGQFICGFKAESTLFYPLTPDELQRVSNAWAVEKRDGKEKSTCRGDVLPF